MSAEYEIKVFDAKTAVITVQYAGADYTMPMYLPVAVDGSVPEGVELHDWIVSRIPPEFVERAKRLEYGVKNAKAIEDLVVPYPSPPPPPTPEEQAKSAAAWMEPGLVLLLKKYGLIKAE